MSRTGDTIVDEPTFDYHLSKGVTVSPSCIRDTPIRGSLHLFRYTCHSNGGLTASKYASTANGIAVHTSRGNDINALTVKDTADGIGGGQRTSSAHFPGSEKVLSISIRV